MALTHEITSVGGNNDFQIWRFKAEIFSRVFNDLTNAVDDALIRTHNSNAKSVKMQVALTIN
jgi:hypothetical protein